MVVAGCPARPVCHFRHTLGPAVNHLPAFPKRQRTGALQDASRGSGTIGQRASVLECGGPPPLFRRGGGWVALVVLLCAVFGALLVLL